MLYAIVILLHKLCIEMMKTILLHRLLDIKFQDREEMLVSEKRIFKNSKHQKKKKKKKKKKKR